MKTKNLFSWAITLSFVGLGLYVLTNFQQISDWVRLYGYQPPSEVVKLADDTTMNDPTRRVFYVNRPELNDKASFSQNCPNQEATIVLGCYVQNRGIYLLDVQEPKLNGVVEVTAAHEVLHAAYERLDDEQRSEVDRMTNDFFQNGLSNDRVKETIENYRKADPSVVPNELHSILASEVRDLPAPLENYYKKYFNNRLKIVELSEQYENAFVQIENEAESIDKQLSNLEDRINSNKARIEATSNEISSERDRLDNLLSSGRNEEYNRSVPGFNSKVNSYNALVRETRGLIDDYNALVERRNELSAAQNSLYDAIDSNIQEL